MTSQDDQEMIETIYVRSQWR